MCDMIDNRMIILCYVIDVYGWFFTHWLSISIGGEGNKHSFILVEGHSSRFIIIFTIRPSRSCTPLRGNTGLGPR